jgi:hypothetical protein
MVAAIAAHEDRFCTTSDITAAYLNADMLTYIRAASSRSK